MIYGQMLENADKKSEDRCTKQDSGKCGFVVAVHGVQIPGKPLLVSMNVEIL
jgi:hypothetical protein